MTLRKPVWTEGLFLTQHHFQVLDSYHEGYVNERMHAALPLSWGVTELEIDERALAAGQLRIRQIAAILPNGTPIVCNESGDDAPPPRQLDSSFPAHLASLGVHVALPHQSDSTENIDLVGKPSSVARYTRQQRRVPDGNTGIGQQDVPWAKPNLRILIGDERREAFDSLQIAELVRGSGGAIVLRDTFVPPILCISASPFLMAGFGRVLLAMTTRQRSLAASRRQRSAAAIDFRADDAAKFWLLNTLNESIPAVSHLVDYGEVHPERAYLVLAELIGKLCTFAVDGDPTAIPKFNFLALGDVFEPMFARALSLLNSVIAERYVEIPLQRRDDGMHLGKIEDAAVLRYEFFLAVSGTLPEAEVRERLPKLSKVASWGQIGALLNSAVNGVQIDLEYRPPGALPVRPGTMFFKLQKTPNYWMDIQGTGTIALYHPLPREALNLALYAVDPQNL
ncbi:MAG TPA: type VI secretion system baseplate subunit TssK [Polyangiaceae bacterium]|jgi:type VI secretion system protein ImpJ